MPDPLTNPLGPLLPLVLALSLGALRWIPALILVPIFAAHALSRIARTAVALALALPVVPGLLPAIAARAPSPGLALGLAAKECAIGLLLATVLAVPLWAVESAGTCLDCQREPVSTISAALTHRRSTQPHRRTHRSSAPCSSTPPASI